MQGHRFSPIRPWGFASVVALAVTVGCSKNEEVPPSPAAAPASAVAPSAATPNAAPSVAAPATAPAGTAAAGDLKWTAPERFHSAPNPSAMRKATYKVSPAAGDTEEAELSVSQAGGSIDANIGRWAGQFEGPGATPKRTEKTVGPLKVTLVDLKGTFSGGGMAMGAAAGPKKGYALRGAIVGTEQPWFFKLTGPEKTVAAASADFDKLVESLHL